METPPRFQIGDRVRTTQRVHRLPAGSIGRIQGIFDTSDLFDVLFVSYRAPLLMYYEQLEVLPPQGEENE
jgi:hypothetical protein